MACERKKGREPAGLPFVFGEMVSINSSCLSDTLDELHPPTATNRAKKDTLNTNLLIMRLLRDPSKGAGIYTVI